MEMQNTARVSTEQVAVTFEHFSNSLEKLESHRSAIRARNATAARQDWLDITGARQSPAKDELKIIVTGNVGSGKSTSIRAVSEISVVGTETKATERDALHRKETTTVAMEYGSVHIDNIKLHLYGTPGQRRFDFMADILRQGANGMVVMIDNGCRDPLAEIGYYLTQHGNFLQNHPGIITITHFDDDNTRTSLFDYHAYILQNGYTCPVMLLDARNKNDVQKALMKLLLEIRNSKVEGCTVNK